MMKVILMTAMDGTYSACGPITSYRAAADTALRIQALAPLDAVVLNLDSPTMVLAELARQAARPAAGPGRVGLGDDPDGDNTP